MSALQEPAADNLRPSFRPACGLLYKLDYELPNAENTVMISAKNKTGFDELLKLISENLADKVSRMELLIPYEKSGLAAALHSHGKVLSEEYRDNGIAVTALVDKLHKHEYEPYLI